MKKVLCMILLIFAFFSAPAVFAEGTNLVQNPGFEEGTDTPYFWTQNFYNKEPGVTESKVVTEGARSGNQSLQIINKQKNDARFTQKIKVNPSTFYKISGWIKTLEVGSGTKGAIISVENLLDTTRDVGNTNGQWEYVEMYGKTNVDQESFVLTLGVGGYGSENTGNAFFDDIRVEEVNDVPVGASEILLYNSNQGGSATTSEDQGGSYVWLIVLALVLIAVGTFLFFIFTSKKVAKSGSSAGASKGAKGSAEPWDKEKQPVISKMQKNDYLIMGIMTLLYLILTPFNLGSVDVPQTEWKSSQMGESFVVELDREYDIEKVGYYHGYDKGRLRIHQITPQGEDKLMLTIDQQDGDLFEWAYKNAGAKTKKVKVIVDGPGAAFMELAFFERGSQEPIPISSKNLKEINTSDEGKGSVANLFDEQDRVAYQNTYMNSTYFDEIYHARTAFEHLHLMPFYETTHPPLGKLFISLGIAVFGMNPFGWRIVGALFGVAMIPIMYLFGKKMFGKTFYAFCTAFLMMFDFMHFTQTRIATIDTYGVFFVILMYYFMYDVFTKKAYTMDYKQSLKPLLFAGIFFGIGSASKWIGMYAGAGLALLYFLAKLLEYIDFEKAKYQLSKKISPNKGRNKAASEGSAINRAVNSMSWTDNFVWKHLIRTSLFCVIFFVIIPVMLYILAYVPILMTPGNEGGVEKVWDYQVGMYRYHADLEDTHPYQSSAISWPVIQKPMWFYSGSDVESGKASTIASFGNPAIWWVGILAVLASIAISIAKRDKKMVVVFVALAFQYLPWFAIDRCIFIYHFFSSTPFVMLCIVYVIKFILEELPGIVQGLTMDKSTGEVVSIVGRFGVYTYLAIVAVLFILFYPVLSGMPVDKGWIEGLKLLDSWTF